jgi:two-component system, OmpR family, sensor histidine kinase MprB
MSLLLRALAARLARSRGPGWLRPRPHQRRPLMLRTRFALAVAGAVAAVTLTIIAVAFLAVRSDLQGQLREELAARVATVYRLAHLHPSQSPARWVPPGRGWFGPASPYTRLVTAQGVVYARPGTPGGLPVSAAVRQAAAGQRADYYSAARVDGVHLMVLTAPLGHGLAVQAAAPLTTVDAELASAGVALATLSALGVATAAVLGWLVARAGLAPVARLAAVAEEVAATGDPGRRVEVDRTDELGRLATSFNTMLSALHRSLAAQRQLVSDASHELRTPLTSLRINVELLASQPGLPAAERQQVLDRVAAQGAELGRLVASVTELARGETVPGGPAGEVPLHRVVADGLDAARRDWPGTPFRAELCPCHVTGHAGRLRSAVRSLLDNAAKFSPPGVPVEVRLAAGELTVRDYGPGIAAADRPHVFDRFYRAAAARGVPGSGLGLSIVRQVAQSHGGTVRAEPAPGGGARLRLRLPAHPAEGPPPVAQAGGPLNRRPPAAEPPAAEPPAAGRPPAGTGGRAAG